MKMLIRADNGKLYKVLEYSSGQRVEIPINKDGSIKWFADKRKINGGKNLCKEL